MPVALEETLPNAERFTRADWYEFIGRNGISPATISGSANDASAIVVGVISNAKLRGAIRYCLGWQTTNSYEDGGTKFQLLRSDPVLHPRFDNLVCVGFDAQPFSPRTTGGLKTAIDENTGGPDLRAYSNWNACYLTLQFKPLNYAFGTNPDGNPTPAPSSEEWTRYTIIETPSCDAQQVSAQGFQLVFVEGPLSGNPAPTVLSQVLPKMGVNLLWLRVPFEWLYGSAGTVPTKLLNGLGKLNKTSWYNYEAGTLLCTRVTIGKYGNPWRYSGSEPRFLCDVRFEFAFFDPYNPLGSKHGWNLQPVPAVAAGITEEQGVPFYDARRAKADGTAESTGPGLYATYEYSTFFDHHDLA